MEQWKMGLCCEAERHDLCAVEYTDKAGVTHRCSCHCHKGKGE